MTTRTILILAIFLATGAATSGLLNVGHAADEHGHESEHAEEILKGPRGGRLLSEDGFAVEITIYETGVPPEFHVYAYTNDEPASPDQVELRVELERLGNRTDTFNFISQDDYLLGSGEVVEPHSFDVTVIAGYQGKDYRWHYENHEGRTLIPKAMARNAGIGTETAGPATLRETLALTGRVRTDPDRMSRVRARFPGVIKVLRRTLGDVVKAGDTLATIQSNESLENYTLRAPIGGQIVVRNAQVGEVTGEQPLFVIADLSQVWVELDVFGRDLLRVQPQQAVEIETFDGYTAQGLIDWVSPLAAHASQSVSARVRLPNPDGALRPGQFAQGRVLVADHPVALAVRQSAIQRFRDFQVVFARFSDTYEVRMLELGRRSDEWVEVLGGLEPGTEYVTVNSYLIKADIEKSGASHDH